MARTKSLQMGRTIVLGRGRYGMGDEKIWFGMEVELEEGDDVLAVEKSMREELDRQEAEERQHWDEKRRARL